VKNKFKSGCKYEIQFWDHCLEEAEILCEVDIWVTRETKTHVFGTWWRIVNSLEHEKNNRELVSIVKSTITRKRKLK
jgi:hypothetical protein